MIAPQSAHKWQANPTLNSKAQHHGPCQLQPSRRDKETDELADGTSEEDVGEEEDEGVGGRDSCLDRLLRSIPIVLPVHKMTHSSGHRLRVRCKYPLDPGLSQYIGRNGCGVCDGGGAGVLKLT
ncbi:hypothetical protein BC936DRAFT_142795 [Jimgerdemannia flammicorona]|uniref:Uncharacterized protein n=1 Tax=Jimgerdemannia flammicorona TaxID=994334 RepID=A0A433DEM1_9FUNG|nr:hypothetical protein BC936DRAFT_142795 [Jimgerdemannia flammicorona]